MADGMIFGPEAMHNAVRQTLLESAIPGDHRFASVMVADRTGLQAAIAVRIGDDWAVHGAVRVVRQAQPGTDTQVTIGATWK